MKKTILFFALLFSLASFAKENVNVLIFGKSIRAAHMNIIPQAIKSTKDMLIANGFFAESTQDPSLLNPVGFSH